MILTLSLCLFAVSCGKAPVRDLELRTYTESASDEPLPARLTLLEGNRFEFRFSAASSYLGYGIYQIDDDKLLLTTDDGKFHYTFTIAEDGLVFDAVNSSENIWFGDFTDGSVFQ